MLKSRSLGLLLGVAAVGASMTFGVVAQQDFYRQDLPTSVLIMPSGTGATPPGGGTSNLEERSREEISESRECPEGTLGQEVRKRIVLTMSDGSLQELEWSDWDASDCRIGEVDRRIEDDTQECEAGFLGEQTRSRVVVIMSNGEQIPQSWTDWDASQCHVGEVSRRPETQSEACEAGFLGQKTREREIVVMSDQTEVEQPWSEWNLSDCHVGEVSRRPESETQACATGLLGLESRTREVVVMSDGTEEPLAWSEWNAEECYVGEVDGRTETESKACATGLLGEEVRSRNVLIMSDGTERPQEWSSWDAAACHVGQVSSRNESESAACPTGYLGNQTRTRTVLVMSNGTEQPQAWSAYNTTACYIGEVSRYTETGTAVCPTGYLGNQTRTRIVLRMSNGTEQPQSWTAYNTSACYIGEVSRYTQTDTQACGSGRLGNRTRTQTVLRMSNGSEQPQGYGGWNESQCYVGVVDTYAYKHESLVGCGTGRYYVARGSTNKSLYSNGTIASAAPQSIPAYGRAELQFARAVVPANDPWSEQGLWGGELIMTGGGGPSTDPYTCVVGAGAYTRDVREYHNCGSFGQQRYDIRRYSLNTTGAISSTLVAGGGCGWY